MLKVLPVRGAQLDRSNPLARGLLAFWTFDGAKDKFHDVSGNDRVLSVANGTPEPIGGPHGWALKLDDAASEYLRRDDKAGITGYPYTLLCWFRTDQYANQGLVMLGGDAHTHYEGLWARADNVVVAHSFYGGGGVKAKTSKSYGTNTWHSAAAVFAASNDRRAFLDGGNKGTSSDDKLHGGGLDHITVGARDYNGGQSLYLSGCVACVAVYDRALSDAEIAAWHRQTADLFDSGPSPAVLYVPAGGQVHWASAAVQGRSAVNAKARRNRQAAVSIEGTTGVIPLLRRLRQGRAAMSGQSDLKETARLTRRLGATVAVASALTPTARLTRWQKATIEAHSGITASATVEGQAAVTWASAEISAAAQISARARATVGIEARVAGQSSVTARARHQRRAAGQVQATSRIRATATLVRTFVPAWGTSNNQVIDGLIVTT